MRKIITPLTCFALLALAIGGAVVFVKTAPQAKKKRPPKRAALVDTQALKAANETVVLQLTGTVVPAEEIQLRARVGGEIVSVSPDFIDGGLLAKGSDVVRIDPVDYELALSSAESSLEKARFDHKLELGRQDVARREWELLKTDDATEQEKELALRIPHLVASKASLKAAESALEKAQLDLERTRVRAPFDGVVLERGVNLGSQALPQDMLARLAGTGAYWVVGSIPVDRLGWVEVPGSGGRVVSASGAVREGRVIKLLGELEEKGRMARLLVEVDDPLCLKPENKEHQPLLLGEYVRVEISGRELQAVYAIPRNALRENRQIWIATREGTLDIREVDVLWRGAEEVLIRDGLSDGDQLIVSDMTAPVQGMDVNTGKRPAKDRPGRPPVSKE